VSSPYCLPFKYPGIVLVLKGKGLDTGRNRVNDQQVLFLECQHGDALHRAA